MDLEGFDSSSFTFSLFQRVFKNVMQLLICVSPQISTEEGIELILLLRQLIKLFLLEVIAVMPLPCYKVVMSGN